MILLMHASLFWIDTDTLKWKVKAEDFGFLHEIPTQLSRTEII